jgi:hypothetical protein
MMVACCFWPSTKFIWEGINLVPGKKSKMRPDMIHFHAPGTLKIGQETTISPKTGDWGGWRGGKSGFLTCICILGHSVEQDIQSFVSMSLVAFSFVLALGRSLDANFC